MAEHHYARLDGFSKWVPLLRIFVQSHTGADTPAYEIQFTSSWPLPRMGEQMKLPDGLYRVEAVMHNLVDGADKQYERLFIDVYVSWIRAL